MENFKVITMPGGEQHVTYEGEKPLKEITNPVLSMRGIVTADKLVAMLLAAEVYRRNIERCKLTYYLPYIPGARQDRISIPEVGWSSCVYGDILSSQWADNIIVVDPHSKEAEIHVRDSCSNLHVISHHHWFLHWIERQKFAPGLHKFIFPDAGALKRYEQSSSIYSPHVVCSKQRDPATGALSGFEVPDIHNWKDNFIWIVDDICDGGWTFNAVATEIRKQLGRNCYLGLAVSHGIFSKGTGELLKNFDKIVTTDSVYDGRYGMDVAVQPLAPVVKYVTGFEIHAEY